MTKTQDQRRHGVRWPAVVAVSFAVAVYTLLPSDLILGPRLALPIVASVLVIALLVVNTRRFTHLDREARFIALALILLLALVNTVALGMLVSSLVQAATGGASLLLGALQIWVVNGLVFGLAYWELDRGGPVVRANAKREDLPAADFRFAQDENSGDVREVAMSSSQDSDWRPGLVDYLYVSCTNSTAFSPTDTMPLSKRTKALMALESIESIILTVLVIARGVSLLG